MSWQWNLKKSETLLKNAINLQDFKQTNLGGGGGVKAKITKSVISQESFI